MEKKEKIVTQNPSLSFHYNIIQRIECGMVLTGTEVKSLRTNGANIKGSFCLIVHNHLEVHNLNIAKYSYCFRANHEEKRNRILLVKKKQIKKIAGEVSKQAVHIIPEKIYFNQKNLAKIVVCLCKVAKKIDKREKIKAREIKKEIKEIKIFINN
jgi:SsrA-binding protein